MKEKLPNPKSPEGKQLYFGRRVGAIALSALALFGAKEATSGIIDKLNGPEIPTLEEGAPGTKQVVVEYGDTVWEFAKEFADEKDMDTGAVVGAILEAEVNEAALSDGLQPGDELTVLATEGKENKEKHVTGQ